MKKNPKVEEEQKVEEEVKKEEVIEQIDTTTKKEVEEVAKPAEE